MAVESEYIMYSENRQECDYFEMDGYGRFYEISSSDTRNLAMQEMDVPPEKIKIIGGVCYLEVTVSELSNKHVYSLYADGGMTQRNDDLNLVIMNETLVYWITYIQENLYSLQVYEVEL